MAGSPKKRKRRERLARIAALEASGYKNPGASRLCPYCGTADRLNRCRTCGTEACLEAHRAFDAERQRAKIQARRDAGTCIACGRDRDPRPARKTGLPILRCRRCRIRDRSWRRRARARKVAEEKKTAAIVRLAEAAIERKRVQQQRLDAGLPYSLAIVPVLPKDTPREKFEI